MFVLTLIGLIVALVVLYLVSTKIMDVAFKKYKYYGIFSETTLVLMTIAYVLIYFGNSIYSDAVVSHGDTLNGILLMSIGGVIVVAKIINNISSMQNSLLGWLFTTYELILYIPITTITAFAVLLGLGGLADVGLVWAL